MRLLIAAAVLALSPAAYAADWVAVCYGQDAQYMQTIGGAGYFHLGLGDGSYSTQKLHQTYYDGNMVCGSADPKAPESAEHVGMVCADITRKAITLMYKDDLSHGKSPKDAPVYCTARVSVH
jgi:hypothetical protein